jgi:hypothetical protein
MKLAMDEVSFEQGGTQIHLRKGPRKQKVVLQPVYHGENGLRTLKELSRSYLTIGKDLTRVLTCVTQIEIG